MNLPLMQSGATLDDFVSAFEEALARDGDAKAARFVPPANHPLYRETLLELIRVELEHGWQLGRACSLEDYFASYAGVFDDSSARQAVAFEEYRQRRQAGENPDPDYYEKRYGVDTRGWPRPDEESEMLSVARSYRNFCQGMGGTDGIASWMQSVRGGSLARVFHDLHQADPRAASRLADGLSGLPAVGSNFLDFQLIEELGRGAFGRVYLARQEALANRLVALKIAPDVGGESRTLAQLQHTHIVPLYSMHRSGPFQAVCMPYFGAVTLADVLRGVSARDALPQSGFDLLGELSTRSGKGRERTLTPSTLAPPQSGERVQSAALSTVPAATLKRLEGFSYVEAVVWLGCCLADGLAHAHERGILHRDLKPANILLTDEGQPMLLDFNLAEDTKLRGSVSSAVMGGTIPYMAPEQLAAFRGGTAPVDGRADLFALGIILYQLLTGQSPFPPPDLPAPAGSSDEAINAFVDSVLHSRTTRAVPVQRWNRSVSPAVWSILSRCLDADPARRYLCARHLQEDLQRQLDCEPLRYAPEPSLRERVRKRFRRSPRLLVKVIAGTALFLVALAAGLGYRESLAKKAEEARAEQLDLTRAANSTFNASIRDIHQALFMLSIDEGPIRRDEGLSQAQAIFERYRLLEDDWRTGPLIVHLHDSERQSELEDKLADLLLVAARRSPPAEALPMLERAEELFGKMPPRAYWKQRAGVLEALGRMSEARVLHDRANAQPPTQARDYYLDGRALMMVRNFRDSLPLLKRASTLDPRSLPAALLQGICHEGLDNLAEAIASYDVCLALDPEFHGGYFNRGLAYSRQGKHAPAIDNYTKALALRPQWLDGHLNRGHARLKWAETRQKDPKLQTAVASEFTRTLLKDAIADFSHVLENDSSKTRVLFFRSSARRLLKDETGADRDFKEGLKRDAGNDERSWAARGYELLYRNEVQEALSCFNQGIAIDPRSFGNLTGKAYLFSEYLHKLEDSLVLCNLVLKEYPDYLYAHFNRGILLARLGRTSEADEDARRSLERDNSAEMQYRVACIYALTSPQKKENAELAVDLLHKALRGGFGAGDLPVDPDLKPLHAHPEFARFRDLARSLATPPKSANR